MIAAPTFCKCTCFTNSTIIPLGPQHAKPVDGNPPPSSRNAAAAVPNPLKNINLDTRASSSSCTQCNRAFCLDYNLPICKGAEEKDVVAMCFQRDSRKDQIIVWCFLLGTAGLLGWTAVQRALHLRDAAGNTRAPLLGGGGGGDGSGHTGRGNIFQRLLASIGISGRNGAPGNNGVGGSLRSPLSSPSAAVPRGQYAPLDGNSAD